MLALAQILAVIIFAVMFIAIIIGKVHRYIPALIGGALTIIIVFLGLMRSTDALFSVLNLASLGQVKFWLPGHEPIESTGINWQTIIFIGGMMIMIEGLAAAGFFRWLCLFVARLVNCKVVPILIAFTLLSGFLSMFIDSITVMLFLATATVELARLLKFDPVPIIIAEIFAANTGGSATMSGDPPNIIIGTSLGYTFTDFIVNTGPLAWAGMVVVLIFFYLAFRRVLTPTAGEEIGADRCPQPASAISSMPLFTANTVIFFLLIILLVTHAQTGLSVAIIGVIVAMLSLLVARKSALHLLKRVDWRTLLFFVGLFVCVGGLEQTGALKAFANYVGEVSGGNMVAVVAIILWVSAIVSAFVDNIPLAATMVPVISQLATLPGISLPTLSWTLALGTDIGGNATPIGASANVVGTAIAEREGYRISWGRYCKWGIPATILVVAVMHLLLFIRYL